MSDADLLSPDLRALLRRLSTIDHVEILLLVTGDPGREWTTAAVAKATERESAQCGALLHALVERGLLVRIPAGRRPDRDTFHFAPDGEATRRAVRELADACIQRPHTVLRTLASWPPTVIHKSSASA